MNARVRGFAAFPPSPGRRRRLTRSWWGKAWVAAVEDTFLDQDLLAQGRRAAHAGHVGSITLSAGRAAAAVHDGDPDLVHHSRVQVEQLGDRDWRRFLDEVAGRAGYLAAVLEREIPRELVRDAEDAGVRLLPGIGEVAMACTCPDWGYACAHTAALCYQVAWLLDADAWLLLLLRGRGQAELLDALRFPQQVAVDAHVARAAARARQLLADAGVSGPDRG